MEEIIVKLDVPIELKEEFKIALAKTIKQFVRRLQFSLANEILSKSKLTQEQSDKLAEEFKEKLSKIHNL